MEKWLPVVGYEGAYEVSDQGRVRSIDRYITQKSAGGGLITRLYKGRLLKPAKSTRSGHVGVSLRSKTYHVHTLVLRTFVGPPPAGLECLHLNHNGADNRLDNLKYGTRRENALMRAAPDSPTYRTHCKRGHAYGPDNVQPYMASLGWRTCRKCQHIWLANRRAERKAVQA